MSGDDVEKNRKKSLKQILADINAKMPAFRKRALGTEGIVYGTVIFALLFVVVIIVQSCTPLRGNMTFGVCHEFLKLHTQYPTTIEIEDTEFWFDADKKTQTYFAQGTRLSYQHMDAFGSLQKETIECTFKKSANPQFEVGDLDRVFFKYIKDVTEKEASPGKGQVFEVEKKYVDLFNRSNSSYIIQMSEPDLEIPYPVDKSQKIPDYPESF